MKLTILGRTYAVVPEMITIASKINSLLQDDDTQIFYIAADRYHPNDDDVILLVNIQKKVAFPVLLHIFNEVVEDYAGTVLSSFPFASVITGNVSEYVICPRREIENHNGKITSRYGIYMNASTMFLCPDLNENFDRFSTSHSFKKKEPAKTTVFAAAMNTQNEQQSHNNNISKQQDNNRSTMNNSRITERTDKPSTETIPPQPIVYSFETQKTNIKSYCNITEHSIPLLLSQNKLLRIIDKKTGAINTIDQQSIYDNKLLGVKNETDIIKHIGKCPVIAYNVQSVKVSDLRHVIKQYDKKKESIAMRQMFSMSAGCLYVTILPSDMISNGMTIRDCAIELHKNANNNYEHLRSAIKSYNQDTYLIYTINGFFVAIVDASKKCKTVSPQKIYDAFPQAKNIGDIMAMFTDAKIIDGTSLNIEKESDVVSISKLPEKAFDLCKAKTIVRDKFFGYDAASKMIICGDIPAQQ